MFQTYYDSISGEIVITVWLNPGYTDKAIFKAKKVEICGEIYFQLISIDYTSAYDEWGYIQANKPENTIRMAWEWAQREARVCLKRYGEWD